MDTDEVVRNYLHQCAVGLAAGAIAKAVSNIGPAWLRPHAGEIARGLADIAMRPLVLDQLLRSGPAQPILVQDPRTGTWREVWPLE